MTDVDQIKQQINIISNEYIGQPLNEDTIKEMNDRLILYFNSLKDKYIIVDGYVDVKTKWKTLSILQKIISFFKKQMKNDQSAIYMDICIITDDTINK